MSKIGHFIDSLDPGGAETLVVDLCSNLARFGFESEVYHFGNTWLREKCREAGIPCVVVPGFRLYKSYKTLLLFTVFFAYFLKRRGIDVLHSHLFGSVSAGCLTSFMSRIPHLGTLHDRYTLEEKKSRIHLIQLASILGTHLVAVSEDLRSYLINMGRLREGAVHTILNGVDLESFRKPVAEKFLSRFGVNDSDIVLICVGRLVDIKGHDVLIEAFGHLKSRDTLKLVLVGDGPKKKDYEEIIYRKGLKDKIILVGHRDDVRDLLNVSDLFVLASRSEGLSCSIIEAMASNLPIVATDVGGNRELVKHGESGYLVSVDDPSDLAMKLQILIDNKTQRKQFGKKSREIATQKFSFDDMLAAYAASYKDMLKQNKTSISKPT